MTLILSATPMSALAAEEPVSHVATNAVTINTAFIEVLVKEAATNNPSVKAANARVRSSILNAESIRTWDDPMAMFGGEVFSPNGMDPSMMGNLAYGLEQKLPLWNRPKMARRVAELEGSMRQAEVNFRIHQLRFEITKALLTTALAEQVVDIGEQDLGWIKATANATDIRYRSGQASVGDTLQIQNEIAKRTDALRTDRRRLDHEHFALNRLLNRAESSPWPRFTLPPIGPAIPLSQKLLNLALDNEPKLKILEQEIRQAEATSALVRKSRLPDVLVGVEGRQYSGDGEFRSGMFSLKLSIPWGNRDKYRKDYEREKQRQKSAEFEREDQTLMVREELHHLSVGVEASRREALLYRDEILARSMQALTSRLSEFESGRGMFRDVLESRRMLLESQLMTVRATAEQHQMLAEMLLWTGLENLEALEPLANEPSLLKHVDHDANTTTPQK